MNTSSFRYPGNDYRRFLELLGRMTDSGYRRVVIRPEQVLSSKCYGNVRLGKLTHYLELSLHSSDNAVVTSYRDFCFMIGDNRFTNIQQECAQTIRSSAESVANRIREIFPDADVTVDLNIPVDEQTNAN